MVTPGAYFSYNLQANNKILELELLHSKNSSVGFKKGELLKMPKMVPATSLAGECCLQKEYENLRNVLAYQQDNIEKMHNDMQDLKARLWIGITNLVI